MNAIKLKIGIAKGRLTRAANFVETIEESTPLELLEIRFEKVETTWLEFSSLYDELFQFLAEGDDVSDFENEFGEYENKYFTAHSRLTQAIRLRKTPEQVVDKQAETSVVEQLALQQSSFLEKLNSRDTNSTNHLPKIVVPPFSGDYQDWPSFRDLFTGSIDCRHNLTPSQKFHFLKSFLRGNAAQLINDITISDSNYFEAWERLERRYDRVQIIVQSYIHTFLSLPSTSVSNVKVLRKITDDADQVVRGLNALDKTSRDPWIIYLLLSKLDPDTNKSWAESIGSKEDCSIMELLDFLQARCDALESCQSLSRPGLTRAKPQITSIRSHVAEASDPKTQCPKCNNDHFLTQCAKFVDLDIASRRSFVKSLSLCFNCLRAGHPSFKCRASYRCRVCKSRHNTLVHPEDTTNYGSNNSSMPSRQQQPPPSSSSSSSNPHQPPIVTNHSLEFNRRRTTILPTILAKIKDSHGNVIDCRVLLDSGSQSSFVVESFAQRLGYPRSHARLPVLGLSSSEAGYTKGCISLQLCSRYNSTHLFVDALVLNKITSNLPSQSIDISSWSHVFDLELADPNFYLSTPVDVLLGADKLWTILKGEQIYGSEGLPLAHRTSFGWVITGEYLEPKVIEDNRCLSSLHSTIDIDLLLQRFWELEEVIPASQNNVDDQAEQHFVKTFTRSLDGKYVVQLPFNSSEITFGNSLSAAVSRLYSMERRFASNPTLYKLYSDFMQEYLALGHMRRIPPDELKTHHGKQFYLPHHAVLKPDSSSTKLRVVFDGSVKDSSGTSLNSMLLVGPPIQRDLIGVCLRFRQHKYVFTADVVKMFRQIWVDDQHIDFQRIVWREHPDQEISHFRLCTVTYGTASAPFLSVRVLKQLADDYKFQFPDASRVLMEDVYVDDVMTGKNSIEELTNLRSELVTLLSRGKLELRKWSSNCWPLLASLPTEDCEFSIFDTERTQSLIKVLGMFWNPVTDEYSFRMAQTLPSVKSTRRTLLSEVSRIFDPLGLLAPSVVLFKMLFQELWSSELKLGWDDPLPPHLTERWNGYRQELNFFEEVHVPRLVFSTMEEIELHGFSDASSVAYGAVVYTRCKVNETEYRVTIVAAKTKVAPLKPISIPRLELCGALLLTRLLALIKSSFTAQITKTFAWCDSEIVLHWLSSPPRRWTTFVANRTAAILETVPRSAWQHIPSEFNPADCASRGVRPSSLPSHELWWTGPSWLSQPEEHWPENRFVSKTLDLDESLIEQKQSRQVQVLATFTGSDIIQSLIEHFSNWYRIQKILAYIFRYLFNVLIPEPYRLTSAISLSEIHYARKHIIKTIQITSFSADIRTLITKKQLPKKSKLLKYSPFIDDEGLLRVGGRIKNSIASFNIKHPIILPSTNKISSLIITDIHRNHQHPGVSETFAIVRQQYWILGSRNLIRKIINRCKKCFMQRKLTTSQLMGDLPAQRIQPSRPFLNSGCDYAGPLTIKLARGRNPKLSKAYIALFVCMATKAMHLELVSDLTTCAFLAALRRFVSRRGLCANIYSDNGTNFQGARRCLNEMHKLVMSETFNQTIAASLTRENIAWHFIPPSAPHFGGLWEAGVKSVKLHLRRVIRSSILTFEELYTVITQIEAVLNSRPLCVLSDDDLNPLTPAHFIIGEPLTAVPEPDVLNIPINRLSHWNHIQNMVQGFWQRWRMEYLTSLQERPKWQQIRENLKIGDLVVIKEPNLPPTKWLLGKIEAVTQGSDGRIRVASVRTKQGTLQRPITKLALLPLS